MLKKPPAPTIADPTPWQLQAFVDRKAKPHWLLASQVVEGIFSTIKTCVVALKWPMGLALLSYLIGVDNLSTNKIQWQIKQHVEHQLSQRNDSKVQVVQQNGPHNGQGFEEPSEKIRDK